MRTGKRISFSTKLLILGLVTMTIVSIYWLRTKESDLSTTTVKREELDKKEDFLWYTRPVLTDMPRIDYREVWNRMWEKFDKGNKYLIPEFIYTEDLRAQIGPIPWEKLPVHVQNAMTLGGKIDYRNEYLNEKNSIPTWKFTEVEYWKHLASEPKTCHGSYTGSCKCFIRAFTEFPVKNQTVLVVGSTSPWIEAIALAYGAVKVTTTDFNLPQLEGIKTVPLEVLPFNQINELYDVVISFSSLEHDGLGRYGDPIHPFGDILRMKAIKNLLKANGLIYLGVPIGRDALAFNSHRIYGHTRFPLLTEGYKYLNFFPDIDKLDHPYPTTWTNSLNYTQWEWGNQPVIVLRNIVP